MRSIPSREGAAGHLSAPGRAAWGRYRALEADLEMTGG